MPRLRRRQAEPTDDWSQLRLLAQFPEQRIYELLRPVVLFGLSPTERARQTGTPQRTLYRQADRFEREGMSSLFDQPKVEKHKALPEEIRKAILELNVEYPAFRPHEIKTICYVRFGRSVGHHTVKRVLAEGPISDRKRRRFEPYHRIPDPYDRRHPIVTLHAEGWNVKTIAAYLEVHRSTVYDALRRWVEEGVAGLDDKSRARKDGVRKADLKAIATVRELQQNPELGAFRIHTALKRMGILLSPRTCGRILARNRELYGLPKPEKEPREPKPMPFQASRRHEYWTVDIRYIDNDLVGGRIYCISILENYSRAILASGLSQSQDLTAYLMVLYAAIRQHGAPEALVSDGGGVFRAKQAQRAYYVWGSRSERSSVGSRGRTTSRRTSMSSAGWRTGTSCEPKRGRICCACTISGWRTSTTRFTGHTGRGPTRGRAPPRCSGGCTAGSSSPRSCTASSIRRASAGSSIAWGTCGSGTGGCMRSGA